MNRASLSSPRCPGTLKEGYNTYCPAIIRNVFQKRQVFHVLNEMPYTMEWQAVKMEGAFFGERNWYRAGLVKNKVVPDQEGEYILKTSADPSSGMRFPIEVPANEHLCLQIAAQIYELDVIPNALIFFPDGEPALICRYYPAMNTFLNFNELWKNFIQKDRIRFYQQVSELIDKVSAASAIVKERLFKQILFLWLTANGSDYTKSSGLVKTSRGDFVLAPIFSAGCTLLHELVPELAPPGALFDGDQNSNVFRENGNYTSNEFESFGRRMRLPENVIRKTLKTYVDKKDQVYELVERAFIPDEAKAVIRYHFSQRIMRLK